MTEQELVKLCSLGESTTVQYKQEFTSQKQTGDYGFCYLSLVTEYHTKEIVGWCVDETLEARFVTEALCMSLGRLNKSRDYDLIHHSDHGVQYASLAHTDILRANSINTDRSGLEGDSECRIEFGMMYRIKCF